VAPGTGPNFGVQTAGCYYYSMKAKTGEENMAFGIRYAALGNGILIMVFSVL